MTKRKDITLIKKIVTSKFVDLLEINNFAFQHFFRFSHSLAGKLNL